MSMRKTFAMTAALTALLCASCSEVESNVNGTDSGQGRIVASVESLPATRTAVGSAVDGSNAVGILWTDGDEIGVFDATGTSQKRYAKVGSETEPIAAFAAYGTEPFAAPAYAYYPYSAANDGRAVSSLTGTLPAVQGMDEGILHGDYKYGRCKGDASTGTGHEFVFSHLFSIARIMVNAEGTPLEGETLESLTVTATHGTGKVSLAGDFTFDARNGSWSQSGEGQNAITLEWKEGIALNGTVTCHASLFPNIIAGDLFTIEARTKSNYRATFTATSLAAFAREQIYNFPVSLNKYQTIKVYDAEGNLIQDGPSKPADPEEVTGTFTCATLNVDGLPQKISGITINGDGPGVNGTTAIGNAVNGLGWDFMAVSEDFEYHSQLAAALSNYNAGKWRGTITSAQLISRADTDGLGFFWKKDGITATGETMVQFTNEEGGLANGANTCIKKGFRHYEVTVAEGVTVDVYITHMNTYSGSGNTESNSYVKAQLAQLRQLRDYVVEKAKANRRPAIIMGDTNMRYTRHDIKANFIDPLTEGGLEVHDPWVMFHRSGTYPSWNSKSLMIQSKFEGDSENDICCSDDQRGEVVDKMWYINVPGADVTLEAKSSMNDVEHFGKSTENAKYSGVTIEDKDGNILEKQDIEYTRTIGLADHFPVVVEFEYTCKKK
ncbi:MAG: fimbrillin family protein [Bacteroidaceae bacterium]